MTLQPFTFEDLLVQATPVRPRLSPDGEQIACQVNHVVDGRMTSSIMIARDGIAGEMLARGRRPEWSPCGSKLLFLGPSGDLRFIDLASRAEHVLLPAECAVETPVWSPDGEAIAFVAHRPTVATDRIVPAAFDHAPLPPAPIVSERLHYREEGRGAFPDGYRSLFVMRIDEGGPRALTPAGWLIGAYEAGGLSRLDEGPVWAADGGTLHVPGRIAPPEDLPFASGIVMCRADGEPGQAVDLLSGQDWFVRLVALGDSGEIAFTGYRHEGGPRFRQDALFLMQPDGKPRQITTPASGRPELLQWVREIGRFIFLVEDGGSRRLWSVDAQGADLKEVAGGPHRLLGALHALADGRAVALTETPDRPAVVTRIDLHGIDATETICDLNAAWVAGRSQPEIRTIEAASSDGERVEGFLSIPSDRSGPLPLMVYLHGGPIQMDSAAFEMRRAAFVGAGYAVLRVNYRGSTGYGERFAQQAWLHPNTLMYDDCLAVIDAAIAQHRINPDRLFVGGFSAGAMMSAGLVSYCDRFRAVYAQMGIYDLRSYFGAVDEPAIRWDQIGRQPFWAEPITGNYRSTLAHADRIRTPILIMAGLADTRTPATQSEELYRAIKLSGSTPARLALFPGLGHSMGGHVLTYFELMNEAMRWFERHDIGGRTSG